jgi:hypothetical protein
VRSTLRAVPAKVPDPFFDTLLERACRSELAHAEQLAGLGVPAGRVAVLAGRHYHRALSLSWRSCYIGWESQGARQGGNRWHRIGAGQDIVVQAI